jgi:hypothetical protein
MEDKGFAIPGSGMAGFSLTLVGYGAVARLNLK